jgi:hypothetical protein
MVTAPRRLLDKAESVSVGWFGKKKKASFMAAGFMVSLSTSKPPHDRDVVIRFVM